MIHTYHVVTADCLLNKGSTVGANFCGLHYKAFTGSFLFSPFSSFFVVLLAGLFMMPRHLVGKASLEPASRAGHDWLVIAASVNLAIFAVWTEAHGEVGHALED